MRHTPPPAFQAEAPVDLAFEVLDRMLRDQAEEHGLALHSGHGRSTWVVLGQGEYGARRDGAGAVVFARADSPDWLFTLKEAAAYQLAELGCVTAQALSWTGPEQAGAHPPNFSLGRVAWVRPLGQNFLRMRIEGQGLERLARDMIHFRFVLPQADGATQWPRLTAAGQAVWPQELHRPAYTISAIDAAAGWLETDIFVHDGGRICAFAANTAAGIEVGLTGPGGGGMPQAASLLIGGDETAYPALARIIAVQDPAARIDCHLFGASTDYPFPAHPGLHLTHRPAGEADLAAKLAQEGVQAERVWIATEKARLQPLKQEILRQIPKDRAHLAAYWIAGR
ncbi:siderophore-interacting protein [Paracoccus xiamenensis]|uniref:siderophore-interacting protein n=1 Tax=Paracoccus xiamenensis TaxID=2714901 RepID=UPI0014075C50|nr:siderophore-interacting protein [Paracoccus xiamenensis]NHF73839.1 siderophore-interacting protein [Paracoccus xiamenensis]